MNHPDPDKPIATCNSESCDSCSLTSALQCHFSKKDFLKYLLFALPPFLLGGIGIGLATGWMLLPWIAMIIVYFEFVEIRVMCSHCPHYAEPGPVIKCWAKHGSRKIWTYRPGPMSFWEKFVFLGGLVIVWGYPLWFLITDSRWALLVIYLLAVASLFTALKKLHCSRCMNFTCPLNSTPDEVRRDFLKRNPKAAKAWE